MARPSKAAIAALKADASLSTEFDAKYGPGAAAPHLQGTGEVTSKLGELLAAQAEASAKIDKLIALHEQLIAAHKAPKSHRVITNDKGEVTGVESLIKD